LFNSLAVLVAFRVSSIMRVLAKSCSRLYARVAVVAVIAAGVAGCTGDVSRFSDTPFSSSMAARPTGGAGEVTGSVPSGRVMAEPLPAPSRPATSGGVATGGGGLASYHPNSAAAATRVASASAPISGASAPVNSASAHPRPAATVTHVVVPGETLTSISRHYRKSRVEIARANKIDAYAIVRVGQKLTIPGVHPAPAPAKAAAHAPEPAAKPTAGKPVAAAPAKPQVAQAGPAKVANSQPVATARLATPAVAAAPEPSRSAVAEVTGAVPSFRWPVRGRVIAGYGTKVNGTANDGINLSVPEGTSVKASEDGVVAYAGNELKGYGNLVLVRHPSGFVTAYAHASEIKVKRGDQVKRGQTIALAGQTGNVNSPQLHFEIRKGSTPIDPTQYLSN
jgi:murein DD-endopeptidase MepM/ murein hydrolase activator NlpD